MALPLWEGHRPNVKGEIPVARFHDILNQYGDAENLPENLLPALMEAYDEDLSVPIAKVGELETARADLETTVSRLKSQNYDLLYKGAGAGDTGSGSASGGGNHDDADEDTNVTIDDLFE